MLLLDDGLFTVAWYVMGTIGWQSYVQKRLFNIECGCIGLVVSYCMGINRLSQA